MQTLETTEIADTTDDMQTIIYQGQPVRATLVNYLSGTIPTSTVDAEGDEELFRDEAGHYYLRRTLNLLRDYHEDGGEGNIEASGRTHVHRINVNAAILWATTRLNSETLHLRRDAADLIMEGRGYFDPDERKAGWTKEKLQTLVESGERLLGLDTPNTARGQTASANASVNADESVTVPLTLPLALYRQVLAMSHHDSHNRSLDLSATVFKSMEGEIKAWMESGDKNPTPQEYLAEFERELDAGQHAEAYQPLAQARESADAELLLSVDLRAPHEERSFVALDGHVTGLLRAYMAANLDDEAGQG